MVEARADGSTSGAQALLREALATLALESIRTEYPHCLVAGSSGEPARATEHPPPRETHPVFYGCYDWHSAVHSHWVLVSLLRLSNGAQANRFGLSGATQRRIEQELELSLEASALGRELDYLEAHPKFEGPYGWAWFLQLALEVRALAALRQSAATAPAMALPLGSEIGVVGTPVEAERWSYALGGLEQLCAARLLGWLERLAAPVASGQHGQSAFALGLLMDWAADPLSTQPEARARASQVALKLHAGAVNAAAPGNCPLRLALEPYGNDFLSPGLAHVDVLGRALDPRRFAEVSESWLEEAERLEPVSCPNPRDGKGAHLVGLNLSRAWMLQRWAGRLTAATGSHAARGLGRVAALHRDLGLAQCGLDPAGLEAEASKPALPYSLSHWIGSFVLYMERAWVAGSSLG